MVIRVVAMAMTLLLLSTVVASACSWYSASALKRALEAEGFEIDKHSGQFLAEGEWTYKFIHPDGRFVILLRPQGVSEKACIFHTGILVPGIDI